MVQTNPNCVNYINEIGLFSQTQTPENPHSGRGELLIFDDMAAAGVQQCFSYSTKYWKFINSILWPSLDSVFIAFRVRETNKMESTVFFLFVPTFYMDEYTNTFICAVLGYLCTLVIEIHWM